MSMCVYVYLNRAVLVPGSLPTSVFVVVYCADVIHVFEHRGLHMFYIYSGQHGNLWRESKSKI